MLDSLLTHKCTLVPKHFFNPSAAEDALREVVKLDGNDNVKYVDVPQYDAVLVYSDYDSISGGHSEALPEMLFILKDLAQCREYNKIVASYCDGILYLAIAQGKSLMLANTYKAQDFVTAEYFIFLAMKSLQLNPEVSTICWRSPVGKEDELSLYRYFKAVEQI